MGSTEQGTNAADETENELVDELYILKSSLVCGQKLTREAPHHLKQILAILEEHPELCTSILKWKFLENEALYCLRSRLFNTSLKVIIVVVSHCKVVPEQYFSKSFLFFITEKLYFSLRGMGDRGYPDAQGKDPDVEIDDPCISDDCSPNLVGDGSGCSETCARSLPVRSNECRVENSLESLGNRKENLDTSHLDCATANARHFSVPSSCREIMVFVRMLITMHRHVANTLFEIGFFDLSNVVITTETAQMFNAVFEGITYSSRTCDKPGKRPWEQDGLYEVQRKLFDPEVVFRSKDIFTPKRLIQKLRSGVFYEIYKQCTSIRDLADLGVEDIIDALLYKRMAYMSDSLDVILLEIKNPKVLRFYRRSLEKGSVPNKSYLNGLVKALDDRKLTREASITLYYFMDLISDFRLFTEERIRKIVMNLEYVCEYECAFGETEVAQARTVVGNDVNGEVLTLTSFDSTLQSNEIFGDGTSGSLIEAPCDISWRGKHPKSMGGRYNDHNAVSSTSHVLLNIDRCERLRTMKLLKFLYNSVEKKMFYKPTYMILVRSVYAHCISERSFMDTYFRDFIGYLNLGPRKIAECLLPQKNLNKPPKMVDITLSDGMACKNMPLDAEAFTGLRREDSELDADGGTDMSRIAQEDDVRIVGMRVESSEEDP